MLINHGHNDSCNIHMVRPSLSSMRNEHHLRIKRTNERAQLMCLSVTFHYAPIRVVKKMNILNTKP